jgi:predicted branched-subunit amino acid permease
MPFAERYCPYYLLLKNIDLVDCCSHIYTCFFIPLSWSSSFPPPPYNDSKIWHYLLLACTSFIAWKATTSLLILWGSLYRFPHSGGMSVFTSMNIQILCPEHLTQYRKNNDWCCMSNALVFVTTTGVAHLL